MLTMLVGTNDFKENIISLCGLYIKLLTNTVKNNDSYLSEGP